MSSTPIHQPRADAWAPELDELAQRRAIAHAVGGEKQVAHQHAQGKLTARERIEHLLDSGSFCEIGALAGAVKYGPDRKRVDFTPSNAVVGVGKIDARRTVVAADDFTIRGGSSEASVSEKWIYADRYAWEYKLPIVRMIDSAGGSVKLLDQLGHTKIRGHQMLPMTQLLGAVPVVGIAFGACAGLGALRVGASHLAAMIRHRSQIFAGGPPVVKQALGIDIDKEALGGYGTVHRYIGVVGLAVDTEDEALRATRRFLSYLPGNVWEKPPRAACEDSPQRRDTWLNQAIPANRRKDFQPRKILKLIFDEGLVFELYRGFGGSTITCLARLNGYAVGVMTNDPMVMGGAMLSPWHGPSGTALPNRYAWPSARWGSIPVEGGVAAAYKKEIAAAVDPVARRLELEAHYHATASPVRTGPSVSACSTSSNPRRRGRCCARGSNTLMVLPDAVSDRSVTRCGNR